MTIRPPGFSSRYAALHRLLRMHRVMQALAEKREVERRFLNGRRFEIAQPVFQIRETVFPRQPRAEFHHLRGVIDRNHTLGPLGEQLRKRAFARAQIADHHGRHQLQQSFGEALP